MDRPATPTSATARDVILEIVRNMKEGLEPLHYSVLPPAVYHVYLHPDDMERLRAIVPRIVEEARRALDAEVEALNGPSLVERLKLARRAAPKVAAPDGGWQIRILENTDDEVAAGDILIYSELALPVKAELGAGSMTRRIATRKLGATKATTPPPTEARGLEAAALEAPAPDDGAFAVIEYADHSGRKTFRMTKNEIVVGRGGRDYWTDIKLDTLPDVSREHFRLRRDADSGNFFLKDLSRLGTTIDGQAAPSSIDFSDGGKRDRNVEAPVPPRARIGLAGVVFLDFRSIQHG
ncbi:MAG TPA: FHA domain-containing protein [Bryobacteraceae bacterium]|nr:FHA domain-containing protein [Bryobacteraceae bacterium]